MKQILTALFISLFCISTLQAQETDDMDQARSEIKINATNLIAFTFIDSSYEYLLNEEASLGVGLLFNVGNDNEILDYYRSFSLTPYYRQYFSNKFAKGFFVEGFGMLNSGKEEIYIFMPNGVDTYREENYTDFALGISAGGKFVTPRGFVAEIYLGVGRNLLGSDFAPEVVGRGGIALGYRF
ncbi:MAG: DUF3575 domain-containing protein [Flavobacteriaceae bacterium]